MVLLHELILEVDGVQLIDRAAIETLIGVRHIEAQRIVVLVVAHIGEVVEFGVVTDLLVATTNTKLLFGYGAESTGADAVAATGTRTVLGADL